MTDALDWIYLKEQRDEDDFEMQAALHGVKLKNRRSKNVPRLSLGEFAAAMGVPARKE